VLILYHLRGGQYDGSWTDAAVRRFAHEMGPVLTDLLDLSRADVTSKRPGKRQKCLGLISELSPADPRDRGARRPRAAAAARARQPADEALALPPGKHIGELRARLEALCEDGEIEARQEPSTTSRSCPPQPRRVGLIVEDSRQR
jgi:poly(A) polymerase